MKKELMIVMNAGFALFAMFFGSGNLVFPIAVGQESEGHFILASLGVLCTCVIFPLLGMLGMTLYKGSIDDFFGCFGKKGVFLFSLLCLSLMGPFGVLARCLTVIHGAVLLIFPKASLEMTSLLMCGTIFILSVNKNRIVTILGTILTPLLLLSIAAIVYFSLNQTLSTGMESVNGLAAFKNGFFKGYQTMDLVASFFFSGFVIKHLYEADPSKTEGKKALKLFLKASLVGAVLLYSVYFSLVLLGWLYAPMLASVPPQEMFGRIALESLGTLAAPSVCAAVVFACLTTAIALTSLFADFLRHEVTQNKIGNPAAIGITLMIAYLVSCLDFSGIANFLGPILETIYPALITLTAINIACKLCGIRSTHWPFTLTLVTKLWV
jgi:branched-chain amino acid:cation transporter, LIVCS family